MNRINNPMKNHIVNVVNNCPVGGEDYADAFCEALLESNSPEEMKALFEDKMKKLGYNEAFIMGFYSGFISEFLKAVQR